MQVKYKFLNSLIYTDNNFFFKILSKENENLLIYKKITKKYFLKEKSYLILGSYMISINICLEEKIKKEIKNHKNKKFLKETEKQNLEKE